MTFDPGQPVSTTNYPPPGHNRIAFVVVAVLVFLALLGCVAGLAQAFMTNPPPPVSPPSMTPYPSWSQVPDPGVRPSPYPQPEVSAS